MDTRIRVVEGRGLSVPGDDIDTDRIMPARYLRCVTFENIGQYAFQDERFDAEGNKKDHPFNDPRHAGASVLAVNKNFGCGSSREHAPQGLLRWGIRAIVGESFAEIFAGNCTAIGLPAVTASPEDVRALMAFTEKNPDAPVAVDVEKKEVRFGDRRAPVSIREAYGAMFLDGSWDSSATLLSAMDQVRKTAGRLPYLDWNLLY